jgi:glycosyltransferase involved in cell wall biosynthesis
MTAKQARPRVLHLLNSFEIGGTERQAVELLKRLDDARFDVRLAALHLRGPFLCEVAGRYPIVREFPLTSFYNANAARQVWRLAGWLRHEHITLLHTHGFYDGLLGVAGARLAQVKCIAAQRHLSLSDRRVHDWGTRLIHRLTDRLLVNSEAIRDYLVESYAVPPAKVALIRNGLLLSEQAARNEHPADAPARLLAHDRLRRELRLNRDARLIGMVARLHPVKGHRYLIEAAVHVIHAFPQAHFLLVGSGPLREELEILAVQLGVSQHVHVLGDRPDAAQLVGDFEVAVLASLQEGLPNAVMEAMAAGTPVVATAVGGTPELIRDGETGYLVQPADADSLAAGINHVLAHPAEAQAVGARGRDHVRQTFDMQRMVAAVETLYDDVLGKPEREGAGSREQGAGSREQGAGSREQGVGSRE